MKGLVSIVKLIFTHCAAERDHINPGSNAGPPDLATSETNKATQCANGSAGKTGSMRMTASASLRSRRISSSSQNLAGSSLG